MLPLDISHCWSKPSSEKLGLAPTVSCQTSSCLHRLSRHCRPACPRAEASQLFHYVWGATAQNRINAAWKRSVTKSSRKASISIWGNCCGTWSDVQFYWAGEYIKVYKWTLLSSASFSSLMPFGSKNCIFSQHLDLHCRFHLRQSRMLCSAAAKQLLLLPGGLTPGQTGWHTGQGLPVWHWSHEGHSSWGLVKNKILLQLKII